MKNLLQQKVFSPNDVSLLAVYLSTSAKDLFLFSFSLVFPLTKSQFIEYYEKNKGENHQFYSVVSTDSGEYCGHFEIKGIYGKHWVVTAAHIFLLPNYRGQGLGVKLVNIILDIAFGSFNLYRVGLIVHVIKERAINVYKKCGFDTKGLVRDVPEFEEERYRLLQMNLLSAHRNR